jgi:hypothetical protein
MNSRITTSVSFVILKIKSMNVFLTGRVIDAFTQCSSYPVHRNLWNLIEWKRWSDFCLRKRSHCWLNCCILHINNKSICIYYKQQSIYLFIVQCVFFIIYFCLLFIFWLLLIAKTGMMAASIIQVNITTAYLKFSNLVPVEKYFSKFLWMWL